MDEGDFEISKQKFIMKLDECKRLCLEFIKTFEDKSFWTNLMKQSKVVPFGEDNRNSLRIPEKNMKQSINDLNQLESTELSAKILENIAKMPKTPDGEPEVIETESDANFIEDMMNMTVNLDRLPNEMIASFN